MPTNSTPWYVEEREWHPSGYRVLWVSEPQPSRGAAKYLKRELITEADGGDTWFVIVPGFPEYKSYAAKQQERGE